MTDTTQETIMEMLKQSSDEFVKLNKIHPQKLIDAYVEEASRIILQYQNPVALVVYFTTLTDKIIKEIVLKPLDKKK